MTNYLVETESGSVYELRYPQIRRIKGMTDPTPGPIVGSPMFLVWEVLDENGSILLKTTMTSSVKTILELGQ